VKRTVLGVAIACVALYLLGFAFWGFGPYRTLIWKQPSSPRDAATALRTHFPANGTYYIPPFGQDAELVEQGFRDGPVAMVHMIAVGGRPSFAPAVMAIGFVLNLIVVTLIAMLLSRAAPALPTYGRRFGFVLLAGLAATILIDGGDIVWWMIDWRWKLYQAFYDFSFWAIAGAILAKFIAPAPFSRMT
jgi:hypothetical protein